jgi:hypothetical protein
MGMTYVMVFEDIGPGHPAVQKIAKIAKCDPLMAFGALVYFWQYVDKLTEDGFIPGADESSIDYQVRLPGFSAALSAYRSKPNEEPWLRFDESGMHIHNYNARGGTSTKQRHKKRTQKQAERATPVAESGDKPATPVATGGDASPTTSFDREKDTKDPPPTPSKPRREPKSKAKSARRKRATEEAEAVKALGPAWEPAIAAVRRIGPAEANSAVLTAAELEHPPDRVLRFVAILERNRSRFESPPGALVSRLSNAETDPLKGWIVEVDDDAPGTAKPPDPEREREDLIAVIQARDKCSPGEASKRADAELARRRAEGRGRGP